MIHIYIQGNKSSNMAISTLELRLLKGWLILLTAIEVPNIYNYLVNNEPLDGFFSTLRNDRPEKRLWSMVLVFLMLSRLQAAFYTNSPGVLAHTAAIHSIEALVFTYEVVRHGGNGSNEILICNIANALWFLSAAIRINTY